MSATISPRVAVFAGTFDPITLGHEDVIRRAAALFDRLLVGVASAHHKSPRLSQAKRMALCQEVLADTANVEVVPFDGLLVDFCQTRGASVMVRSARHASDFDYEAQLAAMNRKLAPQVQTVMLLPEASLQCISSTLVREISALGGSLEALVSVPVQRAMAQPE